MNKIKNISRYILALFFIVAGIGHFIIPEFYFRMMPPYLPAPYTLIYISGVIEFILGIMALMPGYFVLVKWGMILLLLAVFPANIHMASNPQLFPEFAEYGLWLRLPFQIVFIAWVWFSFTPRQKIKNSLTCS